MGPAAGTGRKVYSLEHHNKGQTGRRSVHAWLIAVVLAGTQGIHSSFLAQWELFISYPACLLPSTHRLVVGHMAVAAVVPTPWAAVLPRRAIGRPPVRPSGRLPVLHAVPPSGNHGQHLHHGTRAANAQQMHCTVYRADYDVQHY